MAERRHSGGGNRRGRRASFGSIRQLQSKRFQARYTGPDGKTYRAPVTFDTKTDASAWLANERAKLIRNEWRPASVEGSQVTFATYATTWLEQRKLKPRTRADYKQVLDRFLIPAFGTTPVAKLTREAVRSWYPTLDPATPTMNARVYGLMRTVMGTAVSDGLIDSNPVHIRGAGSVARAKKVRPATPAELDLIVAGMPSKYRALVLLASWCALRFGEATELRRRDLDLEAGVVRIRRAVVRVNSGYVVGEPKSAAGTRDVAIPPYIIPALSRHLDEHVGQDQDALLFPATDGVSHLAPSTLYKVFYPARAAAGRPDLRFHDLRHGGAVLAAQTGATLAELMGRLGHSTPQAAMRYQHAAADRDRAIAQEMSRMFGADVTSSTPEDRRGQRVP